MFTGIIQEIGKIVSVRNTGGGVQLTVDAPVSAPSLAVSDSVSINGVCQTVIGKHGTGFMVEAVEETLKKTTLGGLRPDSRVNLELSVRLSDRLGGHLVLGHVDCTGKVVRVSRQASSWLVDVAFPAEFSRYLIPVGSIAVDGISLTVASLRDGEFTVSIIPHTAQNTTLGVVEGGTAVNLEFDLIGKYVESLMGGKRRGADEDISWDRLREWGYKP
jgi:riboflavin synthase